MMEKKIRWSIRWSMLLLSVFVFNPFTPGSQVLAQWETIFVGSNNNDSAGEYYVDGETIIVGRVGGGLYFSLDGGASWNGEVIKPLGSDSKLGKFFKFKGNYYLHRKDYNPDNFLRSTGDLTEWNTMNGFPDRGDGTNNGIRQVTSNGKIIFVKTWAYLDSNMNEVADFLISEDGDEWIRVGDAIVYAQITFLGDSLFATAGNTLMMSVDTGKTWTGIGEIADSLQIRELHAGTNTLFAKVENRNNRAFKSIAAWNMEDSEWNTVFSIETAFNLNVHVSGNRIGAGNLNTGSYYSPDGGKTWGHLELSEFKAYSAYIVGDYFYSTGPSSGFGQSVRRISLSHFDVSTNTERQSELPSDVLLNQNYPNPFNPTSNISFSINQTGQTDLRVFDMLGREVAVLVSEVKPAGTYNIPVDLSGFSSGVYLYQLRFNGQIKTRKMSLLK